MKNIILTLLLLAALSASAQDAKIKKDSYRILKLDLYDLMGFGIRTVDLSFEQSLFQMRNKNLPTLQTSVRVPLSITGEMDLDWGVEGAAQLRFYPLKRRKSESVAGWFYGVGIQGGYMSYQRTLDYVHQDDFRLHREIDHSYQRMYTGIYGLIGTQTQLTDKLYFEMSLGIGLSTATINKDDTEIPQGYIDNSWWWEVAPLFEYQEGTHQLPLVPINISIGYNFGSK